MDISMTGLTRRELLNNAGLGFGSIALAGLLQNETLRAEPASTTSLAPRSGNIAPKARAVIQLFQNGGVSQMDLFDPKPELDRRHGQPHPTGVEVFQGDNHNVLLKSPFRFRKHGQCGMDMSEVVPHLASVADDLCMVRSMVTKNNNHGLAIHAMQTGTTLAGRPTLGSWISYGLGTENQNLPCYVVLRDPNGYTVAGKMMWASGWLPAVFQGTEFSSSGNAVHHLTPALEISTGSRKQSLDLLARLNHEHLRAHPRENALEARIRNYELAARMQVEASEVADLSRESEATKKMYGMDNEKTAAYGRRLLMARRLVESGVRYVQVFNSVDLTIQPWDNHGDIKGGLEKICAATDQPSAALIMDLKQRGLLDEVLVLWTGEFGRLPTTEGKNGRDHNRNAFTLLMAGGGVKAGFTHGATDDFGYASVDNKVSVHDLHATILHLLGIDHNALTFRQAGRDQTLTDAGVTNARVVDEILA
jgi:hypothetical protein